MAKEIKSKEEFQELLESQKPVLVDFFAEWCGPCQAMKPILEEVAEKVGDQAIVAKINIDENREVAQEYAVASIPTLVFFDKSGKEVDRKIGMTSAEELSGKLVELGK